MKMICCDRCKATTSQDRAHEWRSLSFGNPVETWAPTHLADLCPRCINYIESEIKNACLPAMEKS